MSLSVDEIARGVMHAAYQFGVGMAAGASLDYIFGSFIAPVPVGPGMNPVGLAIAAVEIVAQLAASALFVATLFKALVQRPDSDPAAGFALSMVMVSAQPQLVAKMGNFGRELRSLLSMGGGELGVPTYQQTSAPERARTLGL